MIGSNDEDPMTTSAAEQKNVEHQEDRRARQSEERITNCELGQRSKKSSAVVSSGGAGTPTSASTVTRPGAMETPSVKKQQVILNRPATKMLEKENGSTSCASSAVVLTSASKGDTVGTTFAGSPSPVTSQDGSLRQLESENARLLTFNTACSREIRETRQLSARLQHELGFAREELRQHKKRILALQESVQQEKDLIEREKTEKGRLKLELRAQLKTNAELRGVLQGERTARAQTEKQFASLKERLQHIRQAKKSSEGMVSKRSPSSGSISRATPMYYVRSTRVSWSSWLRNRTAKSRQSRRARNCELCCRSRLPSSDAEVARDSAMADRERIAVKLSRLEKAMKHQGKGKRSVDYGVQGMQMQAEDVDMESGQDNEFDGRRQNARCQDAGEMKTVTSSSNAADAIANASSEKTHLQEELNEARVALGDAEMANWGLQNKVSDAERIAQRREREVAGLSKRVEQLGEALRTADAKSAEHAEHSSKWKLKAAEVVRTNRNLRDQSVEMKKRIEQLEAERAVRANFGRGASSATVQHHESDFGRDGAEARRKHLRTGLTAESGSRVSQIYKNPPQVFNLFEGDGSSIASSATAATEQQQRHSMKFESTKNAEDEGIFVDVPDLCDVENGTRPSLSDPARRVKLTTVGESAASRTQTGTNNDILLSEGLDGDDRGIASVCKETRSASVREDSNRVAVRPRSLSSPREAPRNVQPRPSPNVAADKSDRLANPLQTDDEEEGRVVDDKQSRHAEMTKQGKEQDGPQASKEHLQQEVSSVSPGCSGAWNVEGGIEHEFVLGAKCGAPLTGAESRSPPDTGTLALASPVSPVSSLGRHMDEERLFGPGGVEQSEEDYGLSASLEDMLTNDPALMRLSHSINMLEQYLPAARTTTVTESHTGSRIEKIR
ncbi:unnamed protein product [Amoebophrya sp. A25]|nr:unnamed protein product [Amoebophrya sp. A25]|eukprot:GSA25T00005427001.1